MEDSIIDTGISKLDYTTIVNNEGDYNFIITATDISGDIATSSFNLNLHRVILDFKVTNNYGPAPLVVTVEDITDYTYTGFTPNYWNWRIVGKGCNLGAAGVKKRTLTFTSEGQYTIIMTVSNGTESYSLTKKYIVFVTGSTVYDGTQIELAHDSEPNIMRHIISSSHDRYDKDKNKIEIFVWGSEITGTEVAEKELMEINCDDGIHTVDIDPYTNFYYNIGSETVRWEEYISKDIDLIETKTKILKLWTGK